MLVYEQEQRMDETHKREQTAESLADKAAHAETLRKAHLAEKVATAQGLNPTTAVLSASARSN